MGSRLEQFKNLLQHNALLRGSLIYVLGSIFLKGVAFILIPLYTRVFTPGDYGTMELINTIVSLLNILVTFGFSQLIFIEYTHLGDQKGPYIRKINYAFNVLAIPLLLLAGGLMFSFQQTLFTTPNTMMIVVVVLTVYAGFFQNNLYTVLQLDERPKLVTLNKAIVAVILLVLNVLLVKYLKVGIIGVYISNLAATIISLSLLQRVDRSTGIYLRQSRIPKEEVKHLLKMGFPFIITSLAYFGINGVDRVIIKSMLSANELGLYSVGFKFGAMLEPLLIAPVLSAYNPYLFKKFAGGDFNMNVFRNSIIIMALFAVIAVIMPIVARYVIGVEFQPGLYLIPYFVMGFGFLFLSQMLAAPLLYFKKKKALVYNVVLSSIVNVLLNLLLIRIFKLQGSAIAFLLTNIFWFIITLYQARRTKRYMMLKPFADEIKSTND